MMWISMTRASLLPKDGEMLPLRLNQQCQELTTKKPLYQETGRPFTPIFETRAWIKNLHQAPDGS